MASSSWRAPGVLAQRSTQAVLLLVALLFVAMVVYLPHMDLLEGQVNPTGGVEGRSEAHPWGRLVGGYAAWLGGEHEDYRYPVHVDAHVHWVRSAAVQSDETLRFDHPYTGSERGDVPLTLRGLIHESGYWLMFAQFQQMTGIPWLTLIRFAPAGFAMVTAGLVWAALRPSAAAPLAAAFVALVPTSARFLGIGFWVPIGLGLAWVAAALLLSRNSFSDPRYFVFTMLLGAWAFFVHLIAGFAFLLVVGAAALVSWRENRSRTLLLGAGVLLPFVAFYDAFQASFQTEIEKLGTLPFDFTVFDQLGSPFLMLWALGSALVFLFPPQGRMRVPVMAATMVSAAALSFIVVNLFFGLRIYALYDRWHPIYALLGTVPVAWGVYTLWRIIRRGVEAAWVAWSQRRRLRQGQGATGGNPGQLVLPRAAARSLTAAGVVLVSVFFVLVTSPGLAAHLDEPYYHVMDDDAWRAFNVAKELGPEYEVFLTHPWQAPVLTALSGKHPHTWLNPGSPPVRGEDYGLYRSAMYEDGVWIVSRDITLIIDSRAPTDPAFVTIAPNVHILDPELARQLHEARQG